MIKYLGSKRKLIPTILDLVKSERPESVMDLFSGTSRVGHALQNEGYNVIANDITTYGYYLATTYVQADPDDYPKLKDQIDDLKELTIKETPGWFTTTYCVESQFFQPKNGHRIETFREFIRDFYGDSELAKILVTSLIEAADRVDSTCGIQMAYLKSWAPRSFNDLELRVPALSKGRGKAIQGDAFDVADLDVEMVYLDPPYNQHSYLGNYHIWETLCKWDDPKVYGVAKKREDVKTRKSAWNSKTACKTEFVRLIEKIIAPKVLVSFNDEGYLPPSFIEEVLRKNFLRVERFDIPYDRYVGSKIGIYNPQGKKTGKIDKTKNTEYLYLGTR